MPRLLTRDGRIPKNKWVVVGARAPSRVFSRHRYKSAAMDKALTLASKTGRMYFVAEIGISSLIDAGSSPFSGSWPRSRPPRRFSRSSFLSSAMSSRSTVVLRT